MADRPPGALTLETPGLGDRSYILHDGRSAVVVDPQRDVDRVLAAAEGLEIAAVCETHVHNDYVSGALALSRLTGADLVVCGADDVRVDRRPVAGGDVLQVGGLRVSVRSTPGHTPTHLAYVVEGAGPAPAVLTGGSMLYGTVGRTDLLGGDLAEGLTRAQHASVRELAQALPGDAVVLPTHGFGSFCAAAGGGSRTAGTIADERRENLACRIDDVDAFVAQLLGGLTAHPPYYAHMALLNRAGPGLPDLSLPAPAAPGDLAARVAGGEWVVDVRARRDFAADHLAGTVNVDLEGPMATSLGWAIPWGTPVSLVADTADQVARAQRELVRIGIDRPQAVAVGGPGTFAAGQARRSHRRATFAELAAEGVAERADVAVVDVRRPDEWGAGHLEGAAHVPMERLGADPRSLPPAAELWVHCASGYRASIAASLASRAGRSVVWVDDDWPAARAAGLATTS